MTKYRSSRRLVLAATASGLVFGATAAVASPAAPSVTDNDRTTVVAGILSPASIDAPADIARAYLATAPASIRGIAPSSFLQTRVRTLRSGAAVTFRQHHDGLDVVGGGVAVRIDDQGRVRWARSSAVDVPADLETQPSLSVGEAVSAVSTAMPAYRSLTASSIDHRLVVLALGARAAHPTLAWELRLPMSFTKMEALVVYIDAHSGAVLHAQDRIRHATNHRAKIYEDNPVKTPELQEVTFADLPDDATTLTGPDFPVVSCVDERVCAQEAEDAPFFHFCAFEQLAHVNEDGDFLHLLPPETESFSDAFAEVSTYHHLSRAYAAFRTITGDPQFLSDFDLTAVANVPDVRNPVMCEQTPDGPVVPEDAEFGPMENAFFAPPGAVPGFEGGVIMMGQGANHDYAYGGDVVYHELTHGVFDHLSDVAPGAFVLDKHGINPTAGGMHEGFADYFSSVITGDPFVGDLMASATGLETPFLRSMLNDKTCPENLVGETHDDGEPWSAALWATRARLYDAEQTAFDAAVLTVMAMLGPEATFATASKLIVAELAVVLGSQASDIAVEEFSSRGLEGCNGRVFSLDGGAVKEKMYVRTHPGVSIAGFDTGAPAPMQFVVTLPDATSSVALEAIAVPLSGTEPVNAMLIAKPGAEPILWTHGPDGSEHDAPYSVDLEVVTGEDGIPRVTAIIEGDFPAGPVHMQLVSLDSRDMLVANISSPSGSPDGIKGDDPEAEIPAQSGGCNAGGAAASGGLWLILGICALVLFGMRRKRRLAILSAAIVGSLAAASPASADPIEKPASNRHEGFFVRLSPGFSGAATGTEVQDMELTASGGGGVFGLAVGYSPIENLGIVLESVNHTGFGPEFEREGEPIEVDNEDAAFGVHYLGIGASYYFMPINIYVHGSVGGSLMTYDVPGAEPSESGVGFATNLMLGKEWWVSENWGLGIAAQALIAPSIPDTPEDEADNDITWTTVQLGLLFSATYN